MATRLWLPRDGPSESVSGVRDENKNAAVNGSWDEHFANRSGVTHARCD